MSKYAIYQMTKEKVVVKVECPPPLLINSQQFWKSVRESFKIKPRSLILDSSSMFLFSTYITIKFVSLFTSDAAPERLVPRSVREPH